MVKQHLVTGIISKSLSFGYVIVLHRKTASRQDVAERILSSHLHLSGNQIHKNEIAAKIKPAEQYPGCVAALDLYYGEGLS